MLLFDPNRMMRLRGIDRMFNFLHKRGFTRTTATYILDGTASHIKIEHIGKLCVLLNCTPNDLFEWRRDEKDKLPDEHALNSMVKEKTEIKSLNQMLMDVPPEKLAEVENLLKGLKDG